MLKESIYIKLNKKEILKEFFPNFHKKNITK